MKKTYIAKLDGLEAAFDGERRTYTHAAVRKHAHGGWLIVEARFGRPELTARYKGSGVVVPVELGELSPAGVLQDLKRRHQIALWNIEDYMKSLDYYRRAPDVPAREANIRLYEERIEKAKSLVEKLSKQLAKFEAK